MSADDIVAGGAAPAAILEGGSIVCGASGILNARLACFCRMHVPVFDGEAG